MSKTAVLLALAALTAAEALAQATPPRPVPKGPAPAPAAARKSPGAAVSYKDLKYPPVRPFPIPEIATSTLPAGLRLSLLEDHELPWINIYVLIRAGSMYDPADKVGLATITGQLLFSGGTKSRPQDAVLRRLQDLAAQVDGTTAESSETISISAPKESAEAVLEVLKDMLTAPDFPQDKLDLAKQQLRGAIAHRNDDGLAVLRREMTSTVFGRTSPYGRMIEYANLEKIDRSDLVSQHQRYFFPKNTILAVQGDFETAAMRDRIGKLFANWTVDQPPVPPVPAVRTGGTPGTFLVDKKDLQQAYFGLAQPGGDFRDKDYAALQLMGDILGGGQRNRLTERLRGAALGAAGSWAAGFDHPGLFQVFVSMNPFRTPVVVKAVQEEVARLRNG